LKGFNSLLVEGLTGSGISLRFANIFKKINKNLLFIFENKEKAAYFLNDFETVLGDRDILYFPSSSKNTNKFDFTDDANILLRTQVLSKINNSSKKFIVVSYPEGIFEKVISESTLRKTIKTIKKGDLISIDYINTLLFKFNFEKVDFVSQPGEFSIRGGIIDVFSFADNHPYRIEFNDDSIESLRSFSIGNQLSIQILQEIKLMPNSTREFNLSKRKNIIELFEKEGILLFENIDELINISEKLFDKVSTNFNEIVKENKKLTPHQLFTSKEYLIEKVNSLPKIFFQKSFIFKINNVFKIKQNPQPAFNKKFNLLIEHLTKNNNNGFENYIFCSSQKQAERFNEILNSYEKKVHYKTIVSSIHEGFEDVEGKISCFTDHQIFERYHKFKLKSFFTKKNAISFKELTYLEFGDYVTHIDHGIGIFGGLKKIEIDGSIQEAIKLIYADRDILYLSIHSLHKISKFNGKDGKAPKIYKLGSVAWKKLKQKTKSRVKKIAFNLIELYAKRKVKKGFAFDPDSYLQIELEASFLYEDTPDQVTVTDAIKKDMERETPMDRLVCGDVGFGKTEIAIRAAFKAVDNSKQVVILVPTTILAFQHYKTLSKRLKEFPVNIDYINRFRSTKDRKKIIDKLKKGQIDIIIGTHQLVSKSIEYKDLGLLIVDEEQKFGVSIKEKLRNLKSNIDVLTLTATPIPRTLQFSLMSARDLSIISTPPPNRHPIESHVIKFDNNIIRESILYEIQRGGQIYFINNRVENINEVSEYIKRLVPEASIRIGHGQMKGEILEKNLLDFMNGEYDLLIATTIVENGLDVPNANTILINNANNFGLSDLHQMRGRVGRSNKKAFCYFIIPQIELISSDAKKRMRAIEQYSELGSGIKIAMKDLEIRGAGDLLGGEQSGFINEIGFDTYHKILDEAINELKENEFKNIYSNDENDKSFIKDVIIETDLEVFIPDFYIKNVTERMNVYNRLSKFKTENQLINFKKDLEDRFGKIPRQINELFDSLRLKWRISKYGIEKIILKKNKCVAFFISDENSEFYKGKEFKDILDWINKNGNKIKLKEKKKNNLTKLIMEINDVKSIKDAKDLFHFKETLNLL
jgi:transcription-repair coupling factor (superfamily II helicase)